MLVPRRPCSAHHINTQLSNNRRRPQHPDIATLLLGLHSTRLARNGLDPISHRRHNHQSIVILWAAWEKRDMTPEEPRSRANWLATLSVTPFCGSTGGMVAVAIAAMARHLRQEPCQGVA